MGLGARGCPARPEFLNWALWLSLTVGLGSAFLSTQPIFFPKVSLEQIPKELSLSISGLRYAFFSTHPLYVLLDVLLLIPALMLFWNGQTESICEFNLLWGQGWTALILASAFPLTRILCWYVLSLKIEARKIQNVWMPIAWWYLLFLPFLIFITVAYAESYIQPRLKVPVVEAQSFAGGLDAHPEFHNKIVRVRGVIKRGIAKCGLFGKKEREDFPSGTIILDLGKVNGEIIVQAKVPSMVENLSFEAASKQGQIFETFGRLSKLPNPDKKFICGIEKLPDDPPKGGRTLLEIEIP